jgi:hypothetical protein
VSLASSVLLDDSAYSIPPTLWTGTVCAFSDLQDVKPEGQTHVFSFLVTSFFARAKKEVTRSATGGVEALHFKMKSKHWFPAFSEMTSTFGVKRHD